MIGLRNAPICPAVFMAPVTRPACGPAISRQVPQAAPSRKLSAAPARAISRAASKGGVHRRRRDQCCSRQQQRGESDPAPARTKTERPDGTIGGLPSDQLAQRARLTGSVGLSVVAATAWLRPWFLAMLRAWSAASSRA